MISSMPLVINSLFCLLALSLVYPLNNSPWNITRTFLFCSELTNPGLVQNHKAFYLQTLIKECFPGPVAHCLPVLCLDLLVMPLKACCVPSWWFWYAARFGNHCLKSICCATKLLRLHPFSLS